MSPLLRVARQLLEALLRWVPSRHGNDGLTANERRVMLVHYAATVGFVPPRTPERDAYLNELADKAPGRTWHRPAVTAKSA